MAGRSPKRRGGIRTSDGMRIPDASEAALQMNSVSWGGVVALGNHFTAPPASTEHLVPQIGTVVGRQVEGSLTHCDSTLLPHAAVEVFGYVLPWLETSIGLLTLVGVLTRPALVERGFIDRSTNTRNTLRQDWEQGCS